MAEIIVIGHGGYADGVRTNIQMIAGVPDNMHFIDFRPEQDREDLEKKLDCMLEQLGNSEVLFCCDLSGATPFQISAMRTAMCAERYCTVAGLNSMAYLEIALDSSGSVFEIAERAVETTKNSVLLFPGKE